ncbi:hypothetical protein [Pygmaiobacter massiliensis]|uniref:hypothetical protein n=1 Tax=Pygmaiobacter massiliensis TaxID=1917873 RepID=UPI0028A14867|nr:hypothetical protein [Pygmaiobacter massiliensis]
METKMDAKLQAYRQQLQRRQQLIASALALSCIGIFSINYFFGTAARSHGGDFIHGFQLGLFIGLELLLVYHVSKIMAAQKNDKDLLALYIAEHDERKASIRLHTFATSGLFSMGLLAFAAIVAGFFDEKVCITLIATLFVLALVKLPFKIYYARKF